MSHVDEAFGQNKPSNRTPSGILSATIATTANSLDDDVYVTIRNNEEPEVRLGPCAWTRGINSIGNTIYPTRGDRCIVAFSHEGEPWILQWIPDS